MNDLTYSNSKVGNIRQSKEEDCYEIGKRMRAQDAMELWSWGRLSPVEGALRSFNRSVVSMTIERHGFQVAMFGVMPDDFAGQKACLWLLTTDGIKDIGRIFVRNGRKWINDMLDMYPNLYGYVDLRNEESIRWLTYLGAEWGVKSPQGVDQFLFKRFTFNKHKPIAKINYRQQILDIETKLNQDPRTLHGDCLPLKHNFAEGMYVREIFIPKGLLVIGKIHKKSNPVFVMSGDISIMSEEGIRRFKAPCYLISSPGAKRIGFTHEDTTWVEVFATNETDLAKLEDELIAKSYEELEDVGKHFICEVSKCSS